MKVVVTGTTGYVGGQLARAILDAGGYVLGVDRVPCGANIRGSKYSCIGYGNLQDYDLSSFDMLVHCAGAAHISKDAEFDNISFAFNSIGTEELFKLAASRNLNYFVNLSSASVYGSNYKGPISEDIKLRPSSRYGLSKYIGEKMLMNTQVSYPNTKILHLRPPIIYGAGAPGNIRKLKLIASLGLPLPIKECGGLRSILSIENLVSFIMHLPSTNLNFNGALNIRDLELVRIGDFVKILDCLNGTTTRTFKLPDSMLRMILHRCGMSDVKDKLFSSFVLDTSLLYNNFDWRPIEHSQKPIIS